MDDCPINRKSRFPNLHMLNNEPITKLEALRASGASNIQEILKTESSKALPKKIELKRQTSEINRKYIDRYKRRMQRMLASQEPLIYISKDKAMTATGLGKFTGGTGDEDLKYLSRLDEINNIKRRNKLDPKKFSADLWEKPEDLKHKNAQFNISISDYKKMLEDYESQKLAKQEEIKNRKEKYLEKVLGKKKHAQRKKKFKETLKQNNIKDEKELESDPEIRNIFKIKKRVIKPKLNLEMNLDKEYNTSESDASENLSDSLPRVSLSHSKQSSSESAEDSPQKQVVIPDQRERESSKLLSAKGVKKPVTKTNTLVKKEVSSPSNRPSLLKRTDKAQLKEENKVEEKEIVKKKETRIIAPQKIIINEDDLLPNEDQGLPNDIKFNIFNDREDQYYQIMDVKRMVEDSENLKIECQELDEVKNDETKELIRGLNKNKVTSFDKILEFLKEKDRDISEYIGPNTFLLRDIIYYVNDYRKADEPKITEEEILKKLQQKKTTLSEKDLEKLYKQLEILDSIKLKKKSLNDFFLKRIEQKEIQRAEANAVLAAHYLKLKKYYQDGTFDRYLKQLTLENEDLPQVITKEQTKVVPTTGIDPVTMNKIEKQKKMATMMKEKILNEENAVKVRESVVSKQTKSKEERFKGVVKKWEELKEMKQNLQTHIDRPEVPMTGFIVEEIPNINEIIKNIKDKRTKLEPQKHFEDLLEQSLRRIQDEFHSKDSKALSLEEKMIRYAQDFKENAKKRELLKSNIEKHIADVRPLLDEYWRVEKVEHARRHDEIYCFKSYMKKIRDQSKI